MFSRLTELRNSIQLMPFDMSRDFEKFYISKPISYTSVSMRKFISAFLIFIAIFFCFKSARAVTPEGYETTFRDYLVSASAYQADYDKFILARGKYLNFKSISSETEVIEAAKKMMISKIDFIVKYLAVLRVKLALETNVSSSQESLLYIQLGNEIDSLINTKELIASAQTLSDLDKIDSEIGDKYKKIQKPSFKTLGLIGSRQLANYLKLLKGQVELLGQELDRTTKADFNPEPSKGRLGEIKQQILSQEKRITDQEKKFFEKVENDQDPGNSFNDLNRGLIGINTEITSWLPSLEETIFLISKSQ